MKTISMLTIDVKAKTDEAYDYMIKLAEAFGKAEKDEDVYKVSEELMNEIRDKMQSFIQIIAPGDGMNG
jgi:hypothetical protein